MSKKVIWAGIGLWIGLVVVTVALVDRRDPGASTAAPGASRTFGAREAASALRMIDVAASDGSVTVTAGASEEIIITVDVSTPGTTRRWFERPNGDPARAEFVTERRGDVLVADVLSAGQAPLLERWTITVPQRLRVGVVAHDSAVDVTGVSGGVLVKAAAGLDGAHGRIHVSVPSGLLDLSLGVGTIEATTTTAARGPVTVTAKVGDARLSLAGRKIEAPRRPGPGHSLTLADTGPDAMSLHVGVGDASLIIK